MIDLFTFYCFVQNLKAFCKNNARFRALLGTLQFTERQRDGNFLRQTVNSKEVNNYSCEQCI